MPRFSQPKPSRGILGSMVVKVHFVQGVEGARKRIMRSVLDRIRALKTVSVSQISSNEHVQFAEIGCSWVGLHRDDGARAFQKVLDIIEKSDALIVAQEITFQQLRLENY